MTQAGGYVRTALALLLVAALLFLALSVPDVVNRWYDNHQLGQVEYVDMAYEPYEIVYYHSFEEELDAISKCLERGIELRKLTIEEGDDALGDAELLAIVNKELGELCEHGLFSEDTTAAAIRRRGLNEWYPVGNCRDIYPQNVFFWQLILSLSDGGVLVLNVDRDYHKVYSGVWVTESLWSEEHALEFLYSIYKKEHAELWRQYWGVKGELPPDHEVDIITFEHGNKVCFSWGLEPEQDFYSFNSIVKGIVKQ